MVYVKIFAFIAAAVFVGSLGARLADQALDKAAKPVEE